MQLLGGKFNYPDNVGWYSYRNSFDNFTQAFICAYQLMTVENWNNILFLAERSESGYFLPAIYLISWIIIGNYVLLNLLMAMLLAQFTGEETEDDQMELEDELNEDKKDDENDETNNEFSSQKLPIAHFITLNPKLLGTTVVQQIKNDSQIRPTSTFLFENDDDNDKKKAFEYFTNNKCKKSLYIFKQESKLRMMLYWLIKQNWFEYIVLIVIMLSSIKLAFDTYVDSTDPTMANIYSISSDIDLALTIFFVLEAFLKIIAFGFISNEGCYLRDNWNILDFIIVLSGIIDIASTSVNLPWLKVYFISISINL